MKLKEKAKKDKQQNNPIKTALLRKRTRNYTFCFIQTRNLSEFSGASSTLFAALTRNRKLNQEFLIGKQPYMTITSHRGASATQANFSTKFLSVGRSDEIA